MGEELRNINTEICEIDLMQRCHLWQDFPHDIFGLADSKAVCDIALFLLVSEEAPLARTPKDSDVNRSLALSKLARIFDNSLSRIKVF
jgi:hypothetical protein